MPAKNSWLTYVLQPGESFQKPTGNYAELVEKHQKANGYQKQAGGKK